MCSLGWESGSNPEPVFNQSKVTGESYHFESCPCLLIPFCSPFRLMFSTASKLPPFHLPRVSPSPTTPCSNKTTLANAACAPRDHAWRRASHGRNGYLRPDRHIVAFASAKTRREPLLGALYACEVHERP